MKERRKNSKYDSYELKEAENRERRKREREQLSRKERRSAKKEDKHLEKKKRARNKEFARVTYIFVALFIAMMGYISYFNVVKSRDFISSSYNKRQDSYHR